MYKNKKPYIDRLEEESVMYREPTVRIGDKIARIKPSVMTELLKAYEELSDALTVDS